MTTDKPKVTGTGLRNLLILTLVMCLFNTVMVGALYFILSFGESRTVTIERIERSAFLTEYGINQKAEELIKAGKSEELYRFYDKFTGNREVTYALIAAGIMNDIPLHYLFGTAWAESRFYPTAVNDKKNANGSADYGLMQLNSGTFKQYKKETLLDLKSNIRLACEFILKKHQQYGNWYEVFMGYNGGNTELVKNNTVNYMVSILEYAKKLDVEFSGMF
jgi:soluble lytic murein transglycosylase-like protein